MEIKGTVIHLTDTTAVSESFKKREIVVKAYEDTEYPEEIKFEFTQDKTSLLAETTVGDVVEISYNMRGRSWTNKEGEKMWFNSLVGWKIKTIQKSAAPAYGQGFYPQGRQAAAQPQQQAQPVYQQPAQQAQPVYQQPSQQQYQAPAPQPQQAYQQQAPSYEMNGPSIYPPNPSQLPPVGGYPQNPGVSPAPLPF